jgi:RNA polymerase sigma-54 factor
MDLNQKQNLTQGMRQEQTMTHQQIQALEMLFLPVLELQAMIDSELEKNPVLETEESPELELPAQNDNDDWLEQVLKLDEDKRYIRPGSISKYSKDDEEKRHHYLESVTSEKTFQQSLIDQLRFSDLEPKLYNCCEFVISGLDDDGYLTSHPADLAMASGENVDFIAQAVKVVQSLDPPGVAACDLKERLMLQLERKGLLDAPVYRAVKDYLDDIAANRLPAVAKDMGITIPELQEIIKEIQDLNPRLINEPVSPHEYVQEEVTISEENDDLKVKLNNEYLPNLFISKNYRELLSAEDTPQETRDYIKEKLKSGIFLINSIIQRQTTIKKIVDAVVEVQKEFFLNGYESLKPMTMSQVAEKIGIHETTVSRAVSGKYLRCKYGLLAIRDFFSSGYELEDGNSVSKNVVKNVIKSLISEENSFSPLSDSQIVTELEKKGYKVARRTVAKYRESMNILPSNLRRQYK